MNEHDIARVIGAYDVEVRRNTAEAYNATAAVASDDGTETLWEVVGLAGSLGYTPSDDDIAQLAAATDAYRTALAAEPAAQPRPDASAAGDDPQHRSA